MSTLKVTFNNLSGVTEKIYIGFVPGSTTMGTVKNSKTGKAILPLNYIVDPLGADKPKKQPGKPSVLSFTPNNGISGNDITITGTNFTGAKEVLFGGVAAKSFKVVNPSTITAVVGTGATGAVSVTTPAGKAISSADFSFYPFNGNWYLLDDLSEGVDITSFSGRIYVSYGTPWNVQHQGYEPGQNITDPNFFLRYDKMEITFNNATADVADLTSIDYWSIPMQLDTYLNKVKKQTVLGLLSGVTTQNVFDKLNALSTPPVSGLKGALPALVPGKFTQQPSQKGSGFARIIGPSSYPPAYPLPGGVPTIPFDIFNNYLTALLTNFGPGTKVGAIVPGLGNGVIATIAGNFAGVGPKVPPTGPKSKQTYNLTASIDSSKNITLSGTVSSAKGTTTMLYKLNDLLNPSGIYGGNTPFYFNGATKPINPANDVYGWVGGDLFAGINIGALGSSTTINPPAVSTATMAGALSSSQWFKLPLNLLFANMQGSATSYNQWAATLQVLSQAYNFAYSDRFAHVVVSVYGVDTLQITLHPAAVKMS
ncbi:MAG: IPT/TIG domain-containing protein [Bacteroidia bacterium]|nr:IPT/TIG domain-containing protein [Bacteroidia bacterium]